MILQQTSAVLLLAISMAAALAGGIIKKYFCAKISDGAVDRQIYNALSSLSAAVSLLLLNGISKVSGFTIFLGIVFGVVTALQQISSLKSMELGPWSYTSVIISLSTLIPTVSGALFWSEEIYFIQFVGIICMIGCLILSVNLKTDKKKISISWLLYCMIVFFCTGFIGIMQKRHQNSEFKYELNSFLIVSFLVSFLYSVVSCTFLSKREEKSSTYAGYSIFVLIIIVASGIFAAINNILNLYLSGIMESAVFFPVVNVGGLILTTFTAVFLFQERLTQRQWIGIVLGIVSVFFLCNPIM